MKVLCINSKGTEIYSTVINGLIIRKKIESGNIYTIRKIIHNYSFDNPNVIVDGYLLEETGLMPIIKNRNGTSEMPYPSLRFIPFNPSEIESEFKEEYLIKITK